jgi:quercetin dioxygenase-like cupin family protein
MTQHSASRQAPARAATVLANTRVFAADTGEPGTSGAVWKLTETERDLDANVIALPPGGVIDAHTGPDLDVLIHVLAGSGRLTSGDDTLELAPGALVWLPRRSPRQFTAGPDGVRYLTVHQRRQALVLRPPGQE